MKRIVFFLLAIFLLYAFAVNPCISHASSDIRDHADYGDAIIVGSIAAPKTFIPILASDGASAEICGMLFNGLLKYDKDLRLIGDLAERYEILQGGKKIIFYLRRGVFWHDGRALSAHDVKFTYDMIVSKDVACPYSADFEKIDSVTVIDPYTVAVIYKTPFAPALDSWTMWMIPKHLLHDFSAQRIAFSAHPVGTGPYVFSRYVRGQFVELRANERYYEGKPYIARYVYKISGDPDTMFLQLQATELDMMGLSPLHYIKQTVSAYFTRHFNKFRYPAFGYTYLGFNMREPRFQDKRFRLAIHYAINKKEIVEAVLLGLGRVSRGIFPEQSWAFDPTVPESPYDHEKAKALLAECGYRDTNDDGWLEDAEGRKLTFSIITNQGNMQRKMAAEIIQRDLARVGVRVTIRIFEWSVFLDEFVNKGRFESVLLGWSLGRDPDCYNIWHSSQAKPGGLNFIGYRNASVDTLLEEARSTFDHARRKELYGKIQNMIYQDCPYIFLYARRVVIVNSRFHNIEASRRG
jgi:peptide/nickel transport system substrate-binding protein